MLAKNKSISVSGSSKVEENGEEIVVMTFNSNINESGSISGNYYIQNNEKYRTHKESVDADRAEFDEYVQSLA